MVRPGETVLKFCRLPEAGGSGDWSSGSPSSSCALFLNARAAFKLALDWKGMVTTLPLRASDAYAGSTAAQRGGARARAARARSSSTWCPRTRSPNRRDVERAARLAYPHGSLHVVVVTRKRRSAQPHPGMGVSTPAELVRRFRDEPAALAAEDAHACGGARRRGPQGASAQLGAASRGAARASLGEAW